MGIAHEVVIDRRPAGRTPAVSVIMPVFNVAPYVKEAVQSILLQTHVDFEFLVVDDGSTDQTLEIVTATDDIRVVVLRQDNSGYPKAMNTGLMYARAPLVARMDGDDLCRPHRLEMQKAFLDAHPDFGLVGTRWTYVTPRGRMLVGASFHQHTWSEATWDAIYSGKKGFADPSAMFRAQAVREVGGYRTYQRSGQDIDLWLRMTAGGWKAAVLEEALYQFRLTVGSISDNPVTAALSRVPRILADERRAVGSDRVMRGESVDGLLTTEMLASASVWYGRDLWRKAEVCLNLGDVRSALAFMVRAVRVQGVSPASASGVVDLFRSSMSRGRILRNDDSSKR